MPSCIPAENSARAGAAHGPPKLDRQVVTVRRFLVARVRPWPKNGQTKPSMSAEEATRMATDDPNPIPSWKRLMGLLEPLYRRRARKDGESRREPSEALPPAKP